MNHIIYICREYISNPHLTQRELSIRMGISLGLVNQTIAKAVEQGLLIKKEKTYHITSLGIETLQPYKVDAAIILAAGFGSRFVPLTFDLPKGLLKVEGERMIERQIRQLHAVGITDITIIVGYLKEKFEYLIDLYGVKLLYNPEYSIKNTIATLYHAKHLFRERNVYILASDNWIRNNIYHTYEPNTWYSASYMEGNTNEWCISYNKKLCITNIQIGGKDSYVMYGPAYFTKEFSEVFFPYLESTYHRPGTGDFHWEQVYIDLLHQKNIIAQNPALKMYINKQPSNQVYEFENLEELRKFDTSYYHSSDNIAMELIASIFKTSQKSIIGLSCLKSGMTNQSFLFQIQEEPQKYFICRIPGKGTDLLINRQAEYKNYQTVKNLDITENILYFNPHTGYKIAEFYHHARNANFQSQEDKISCMSVLRKLHRSNCHVPHSFHIGKQIDFFEKICLETGEIPFEDYSLIRMQMDQLLYFLKSLQRPQVLAHIDPVADNFIFIPNSSHKDDVRLIDWEYAGMADPLIDIAMSSIYSFFSRTEAENLLEIYLERSASKEEKKILYSYMALGGFLWSLWAIYKSHLGETFGEYTLIMYRYAKDYYKLVIS